MIRFFGLLLIAIGGLIAVVCGVCSIGAFGSLMAVSVDAWPRVGIVISAMGISSTFLFVLVVGGLPLLVGLGLFIGGLRLAFAVPELDGRTAVSDPTLEHPTVPKAPWRLTVARATGVLLLVSGTVIGAYFLLFAFGTISLERVVLMGRAPPEVIGESDRLVPRLPSASMSSRITGGGFAVIGTLIFLKGFRMIRARRMAAADDDVPGPILAMPRVASEHPDDTGVRREDP